MIRIGLTTEQKENEVRKYCAEHNIKKVLCFSPPAFPLGFRPEADFEEVMWADIIMYKFFYRLLEEIKDDYLIVVNELLRTGNRSDLTYSCLHHYINQTPHVIVFEYLPFIEDENDFMIPLGFSARNRYKGIGIKDIDLSEHDIQCVRRFVGFEAIKVPVSDEARAQYEEEKTKLFDEIGNKDPDTIPRALHIWAGNQKKGAIDSDKLYIARNARFKVKNVTTYEKREPGDRILIDFPVRRINLCDYLKASGAQHTKCLITPLSVDKHYFKDYSEWAQRLEEFYAKAGVYPADRA